MAFFRIKFQILGLLVPDKNKYNPLFLRQQAYIWHYVRLVTPVLYSKKNINDDKELSQAIDIQSKNSERYGKRKKMRFLNFRRNSSTRIKERLKIINFKTQKLPFRKFWEYVFGSKKSLSDPYRLPHRQRQARRKENPRLYNPRYQTTSAPQENPRLYNPRYQTTSAPQENPRLYNPRYQTTSENVVIYTEPINKSSRNPRNLEPQSSSKYKMPRAVLLNKMLMDGFEMNNKYNGKTITYTMTRRPYDEMKPPLNFRRDIELGRDVKSEGNEKSVPQISTQTSAAKAHDSTAKISHQEMMKQEKPRRHSRIEQLEILVNEKMLELKRVPRINPENSNK